MILVNAMSDENYRRRQQEEENRRKRSSNEFDQLFEAARREVKDEAGDYRTSGYTRDAVGYEYQVRRRTYM